MQITIFASGSSGNCSVVSDGGTNILIDAGISLKRISAGLDEAEIEGIDGVLITHEHSDHISGLPMLLKRRGTPVYTTHTVANRLRGMLPDIDGFVREIITDEPFCIGGASVTAFSTPHDSADSVGYRIEGHGILGFATDTGCVTEEMLSGLAGADAAVIEANHDIDMLRYGRYPVYLKRRILSDTGHLSNENCAKLAKTLAQSGTHRIILGHLSRDNNTPSTAKKAVEKALEGTGTEVLVAPVSGCLTVPVGRESLCLA